MSDLVRITECALENAVRIQSEHPEWVGLSLRVYLDGKGCDGFNYGVSFDKAEKEDKHFRHIVKKGLLDLIVDPETFKFVKGSTIVWADDERGTGFIIENPSHKKFRGKFYKRKNWEERLL